MKTDAQQRATAGEALSRATDLVGDIARDSVSVARGYLELARHDVRRELADARETLLYAASAVLLAATAGLLLAVGLCLGLARLLEVPPWTTLSAVGTAGLIVSAVISALARGRAGDVEPPEVIEEAKEDLAWIAEQS